MHLQFQIEKIVDEFNKYLQIARKVLNFIVEENLPFKIVESKAFRDLLEKTCGRKIQMPTRYKIMSLLQDDYKNMKSTLKEVLAKQEHLCITADVWSSRAQSYLGLTVHYINDLFQRESYVLAFRQLKFKQTYIELAKAMTEIFEDFRN